MSVRYGHIAWCYDFCASAYSVGAIRRAKGWHVARVSPGDRVLYVGAGTGREVAAACAAHPDIEVVCIEPCSAMARRLRRRLAPWADRVKIIEAPLRAAEGAGGFDWVCGHFFFNVFDARTMPGVLAMAASHVRPGGRLVVADFAGGCQSPRAACIFNLAAALAPSPSEGEGWGEGRQSDPLSHKTQTSIPRQTLPPAPSLRAGRGSRKMENNDARCSKRQRGVGLVGETPTASLTLGALTMAGSLLRAAYYRPVNLAGWGLGMCALHPIYDYKPLLASLGFVVEERAGLRSLPYTPALYEVVSARKKQGG